MAPVSGPPFLLEPLSATHQVALCRTGEPLIDQYLHQDALAEQQRRIAAVYVAVNAANRVVTGFFSISPLGVRLSDPLMRHHPLLKTPYPVIGGFLLGRLGVHRSQQGAGIGGALVVLAIEKVRDASSQVGGMFLAVDPKTQRLADWYEKLGFVRLDPAPGKGSSRRMVLPLQTNE